MIFVWAMLTIAFVLDLIAMVMLAAINVKLSDMDKRLAVLEKEWTGR